MQSASKPILLLSFLASMLALAGLPEESMAQRFNHGSFGRPGGGAPPPAAPARVSPQPFRPETRPAAPPARPEVRQEARPGAQPGGQPQERVTINGGSRNFGNHDFSRPGAVERQVPVRQNVTVRDHINVYHTGGYRGVHPYYYHPYRPYYWGPHWHPLGFFLPALAADAVVLTFDNRHYYYDDGVYYLPSNGGYTVVPAPIGAIVGALPPGYETTTAADGNTYFYFGGVFYIYTGQGYQVVPAPPGAVITQLPVGAVEQGINGEILLVYNNTYYLPISQDGEDAYEVVNP
jgi:hypothetical protein